MISDFFQIAAGALLFFACFVPKRFTFPVAGEKPPNAEADAKEGMLNKLGFGYLIIGFLLSTIGFDLDIQQMFPNIFIRLIVSGFGAGALSLLGWKISIVYSDYKLKKAPPLTQRQISDSGSATIVSDAEVISMVDSLFDSQH